MAHKTDMASESHLTRAVRRAAGFREDTDGAATVMGLFTFLMAVTVLGVSLDRANGWRVRTHLQVAADAAALAAAANLDDIDHARSVAIETARRNLSSNAELSAGDVIFGSLDPDTLQFVAAPDEDGDFTAVFVEAGQTAARGNEVGTFLLNIVGIDSLNVVAGSVATASSAAGESIGSSCADAFFLSTNTVQTGGGNDFMGAVCVHGANGVSTGGGDMFNENVRFTSRSENNININSYSPSSIDVENLIGERNLSPVFLGNLEGMRTSIWDDLWISRSADPSLWEQPDAPWGGKLWYYVGEYELDEATYSGILPDFVFDATGKARVEMHDQYWNIQPGDLAPHTIYLSEQTLQFAGGVDIQDAAFISKQDIGVGGGSQLFFDDVFFIGTNINMAGSITWGDRVNSCDVDYGAYLFGTSRLSLGGWYSGASVNGMIAAAPIFDPGGGMQGTGVYFETNSALSMGGAYDLFGCETPRASQFPLGDVEITGSTMVAGSSLYR